MALERLREKLKGNPLEKLKVRELREEEIRLKNSLDRIRKSIEEDERRKKELFRAGIGADAIKKRMLALEMKALDTEAKLKLRNFTTALRQLSFVKNLLILKNYEKELKNIGIWKKITSISGEKLEAWLIRVSLDGKEFNDILNDLNKFFEVGVPAEGERVEEEEARLFEAWEKVEAGSLGVEDVEKEIAISKELEKEEREG